MLICMARNAIRVQSKTNTCDTFNKNSVLNCQRAKCAVERRIMAKTTPSKPVAGSTLSMRKRNARQAAEGYKRQTVALSPRAVEVVDGVKSRQGLSSREAALNTILERIGDDMFLRQEFLAVST